MELTSTGLPRARWLWAAVLGCLLSTPSPALDPQKRLTQYTRTVWMQEHGLPQDTIRAIAQTADGYLWLGTDEGLARFDGYDFVVYTKKRGDLPANSISALAAGTDRSLWIGTSNGLARYRDKRFQTYTTKDGLPEDDILALKVDHAGNLWIVAGLYLCRFDGTRFTTYAPGGADLPLNSVRAVHEDRQHNIWVGGSGGVGIMQDGKYRAVLDQSVFRDAILTQIRDDRRGNLWVATSQGLVERSAGGQIRQFTEREGLPDRFVRTILEDRDGNIWAGTNGGLARSLGDRFSAAGDERREGDLVRSLFEDREGNLWVGTNNGLARLRDDAFSVYGTPEGLPSDNPNTVVQDRAGRVWIGFHEGGLLLFSGGTSRLITPRDGLPDAEIFSLHATRGGDLLIATRSGLFRMRAGRGIPQLLASGTVFDALEDSAGRLWVATPGGLLEVRRGSSRMVIPGGLLLASAVVSLCEGRDGALWAGTWGKGLWRIENGENTRLFTVRDGLSSDQIRALHEDGDGTLWVGTFGGGLNQRAGGKFLSFMQKDGILSDNIPSIADDGESLWLGTTRGICRIAKSQLHEFAQGRRESLEATNFGVADGLRSDQCSPGYPTAGGAMRTADGQLWFATSRGVAVFDPRVRRRPAMPATLDLVDMIVSGVHIGFKQPKLPSESDRVQIRYTGIHLSAPERVQYYHRLDGLDRDWVRAGSRRVINYNSLGHGTYRFNVRAEVQGGPASERSFSFEVLPKYYETVWFRALCALALIASVWGAFRLRMRQIRSRFALVLEERARLAREIHDTLAQGFVGISAQLDAVALSMPEGDSPSRNYLEMARRMARHSLTEARRSVMDLRASVLDGQDLGSALQSGTKLWAAGAGVKMDVAVDGTRDLPQEIEQHLLRIAQEAVANALKHASASRISVRLHMEPHELNLRVADDGHGFEPEDVFSSRAGHFGLIGMRERAKRLGGEFRLTTGPGKGTEVEVTVPLT